MANTYYSGRIGNGRCNLTTITAATYTATTDDHVILCDCTANAINITLPTASTSTNKLIVIKKTDSTANAVTVTGTIDGLTNYALVKQYDEMQVATDGTAWYAIGNAPGKYRRLSGPTTVLLTAATQTTLFTVPTGRTATILDVVVYGIVVSTGSTKTSTLKVGTTTGSYAELLNGATGMVQATATASSLLANNTAISGNEFYPPATVSVADTYNFAAGSVIKADVSTGGSLPTTGTVAVELFGYLL